MQPIILLHGALGASSSLLPLSNALSTNGEVHAIDFSGHGEAKWPAEGGFSMETFEADVLRFMDAHDIPAAHIFGYSMGGFIALRLASRAPERVTSVSTLATKMDWSEETCVKEASMLNAGVLEAKVPKLVAALNAAHPQAGWCKIVEHTQALLLNMYHYRFRAEELGLIKQPVRMMVGDRDKMVSIDETLAAYRALPNASLCVLPDTPHPLEGVDNALLATLIQQAIVKAFA